MLIIILKDMENNWKTVSSQMEQCADHNLLNEDRIRPF